jgi:hypothetical protein
MIAAIVDELAPNLVARNSIGHIGAAQLLLTAGDNPERLRSEASFASLCGVRFPGRRERLSGICSTVEEIASLIARCTSSPSVAYEPTRGPRTTSLAGLPKAIPNLTPFEP